MAVADSAVGGRNVDAVYSPVTIATSVGLLLSLLISITLCGWCISKVKHSYRKYKIGRKVHSSGAHIHVSKSEESIPLKKKHHKHHLSQPPASQVQKPAQHSHPHTPQIHKAHQPEKPKIVVEHEHKTPQTYLHVYPQQREKFTPVLGRRTIDFERPVRKATSLEHIPPQREGMDDSSSDMSTTSPMISLASLKDTLGLGAYEEEKGTDEPDCATIDHGLGRLQFQVFYDFTEQTLVVKIFKAVSLPAKDFSGTSDPFVKIMLLPDKKRKLETKVKRKKLNPIWNEMFLFEKFPYNKLQERVLHLQILDYDRFSRNDPIGEVNLPLAELDLTNPTTYWKNLVPCKGSKQSSGELLLSLCYAPTAGRITIVVLKCRDLKAMDLTGKSDPYVKIWLMYKGRRIEKKKTRIKHRDLNPIFNESFIFNITVDKLMDTTFYVTVMDKDRLSRNETIGGVILGPKSGPKEEKHWSDMLAKPRVPVAEWHHLKEIPSP